MRRKDKVKYKTERLELRVSPKLKNILLKETNGDNISAYIKECIARTIINTSIKWHAYDQDEKNYIANYFKDCYKS